MIPAFRSPISGAVTTGSNHFEAFASSDVPGIDAIPEESFLESEGWLDGDRFLTREEALAERGYSRVEDR